MQHSQLHKDITVYGTSSETFTVFITRLKIKSRVGLWAEEKLQPQNLFISTQMTVRPVLPSDTILFAPDSNDEQDDNSYHDIICYYKIATYIQDQLENTSHTLFIETIADFLAEGILADTRILRLVITVEKPQALTGAETLGISKTFISPQIKLSSIA